MALPRRLAAVIAVTFLFSALSEAFYLPGLAPTNFCPKNVLIKNPEAKCQVDKFNSFVCDFSHKESSVRTR